MTEEIQQNKGMESFEENLSHQLRLDIGCVLAALGKEFNK